MAAAATYGGDDVSALVLDVGSAWTKAGYAGEDSPCAYFPSSIGFDSSYHIGDCAITKYRQNMEIKNPFREGLVYDWDLYEKLWIHSFESQLRVNTKEHPLLLIEPVWNTKESRRKVMEMAFEKFDVPAFYLVKSAVAASFAAGRGNSLVFESGASMSSVCALHDGIVLNKTIIKQPFAGDSLTELTKSYYGTHHGREVHPLYSVLEKTQVPVGQMCNPKLRHVNPTESFHRNAQMRLFNEFKETTFAVSDTPLVHGSVALSKPFEFPCGYTAICENPYMIPEYLFQPHMFQGATHMGVVEMMYNCLQSMDPDGRAVALGNIVVTGGTCMFPGFIDRLHNDLPRVIPGAKSKVHPPSTIPEKKFGSWLGGSILGSLGTFHRMWISRKEYDESGKRIIDIKC